MRANFPEPNGRRPSRLTPISDARVFARPDGGSVEAWLRRRLRTTLTLVLIAGVFQIAGFLLDWIPRSQSVGIAPSRLNAEEVDFSQPRAVPPVGWRRTPDGWQHVSTWQPQPIRVSLDQRISMQRASEPRWLRVGSEKLRGASPVVFAAGQILAVAMLMMATRVRREFWAMATDD